MTAVQTLKLEPALSVVEVVALCICCETLKDVSILERWRKVWQTNNGPSSLSIAFGRKEHRQRLGADARRCD